MKKIYRICLNIQLLAWFPFMWFCLWGSYQEPITRGIVVGVGFIICLFNGLVFIRYAPNDKYWKTTDELLKLKNKYEDAIKSFENARAELVKFVLNNKN